MAGLVSESVCVCNGFFLVLCMYVLIYNLTYITIMAAMAGAQAPSGNYSPPIYRRILGYVDAARSLYSDPLPFITVDQKIAVFLL